MERQTINRVVIAGGGTAGWVTAASLSHNLGPALDITLVESEAIGTIGVGEATIPTHTSFHAMLGINEAEFMRATHATFKLGIQFEGWKDKGESYIHSFGQVGKHTWMAPFHHLWLHARDLGIEGDFEDYCLELKAAKADKFYTSDKQKPLNYAYHLDAVAYAKYLRGFSEKKGVKRVEGKIQNVLQHAESGNIKAVELENGALIEGDLFIDCTGFNGLLIEKTLKTGYDDWRHWLPMDSAYAVQTQKTGPAIPYTRAIAHENGWRWRIPLQHRVGNGFVFTSEKLSNDDAREQFENALEGEALTEPRLIRFITGRRKKVWNKNCVALGLSSGFLEPLESTSIHLFQRGVTELVKHFPYHGITPALADLYNDKISKEVEQIRDFLILHYKVTQRDDSEFWRERQAMDIPDTLAARLSLFEENAHAYNGCDELFLLDSWIQVMFGQGIEPKGYHAIGQLFPKDRLENALKSQREKVASTLAQLPSHQEFIDQYCS